MPDRFGPSQKANDAGEFGGAVQPCDDVELEVEFFDCWSEEIMDSSIAALKQLPTHESIYSEAAAPLSMMKGGTHKQYINLPREDKWRGYDPGKTPEKDDVFCVDRAGDCPRILVRFKHKRAGCGVSLERKVRLELEPVGADNIEYNEVANGGVPSEKERLGADMRLEAEVTTCYAGYFIIDGSSPLFYEGEKINLATLAGNKYKIRATSVDDPALTVVSKGTIETWRYMWLQKVQCGHGMWVPQNDPFAGLETVVKSYNDVFVRMDATLDIMYTEYYECIVRSEMNSVYEYTYRLLEKHPKKPHMIAVFASRMMISTFEDPAKREFFVGPGAKEEIFTFLGPIAAYKQYDGTKFVDSKWLLGATFNGEEIDSKYIKCVGGGNTTGSQGDSEEYFLGSHLVVDAKSLSNDYKYGKVEIIANVVDVNRTSGGVTWPGIHLTYFFSEFVYFQKSSNPPKVIGLSLHRKSSSIMTHEIGHAMGLTTKGTSLTSDKHEYYYNNIGTNDDYVLSRHNGNHCKIGYEMTDVLDENTVREYPSSVVNHVTKKTVRYKHGICVMFGEVKHEEFCEHCRETIRKNNYKNGLG